MFTTVMLWLCVFLTLLSSILSFTYAFTKKMVNERVVYFISFLYQCAVIYLLMN